MPGETLWFKAYIPSNSDLQSEGLFVRIIDEDKQTVIEKEFPVYDIRAHGDILLADTLLEPGNYQFCAYTDKMLNFEGDDTFVQSFKVVSNPGLQLQASAYVKDTLALVPGKQVELICNLKQNGLNVKNFKGQYRLLGTKGEILAEGKVNQHTAGRGMITFVYPNIDSTKSLTLQATFTKDTVATRFVLNLPPPKSSVSVIVSAEGGKLVENQAAKLLIETTNSSGQPLPSFLTLYSNKETIAQVQTNNKGLGVLHFTPRNRKVYHWVLKQDTQRQIPLNLMVHASGWTLNLKESNNDKSVVVKNNGMPTQATLVLRSMDEIIWHQKINVKDGESLNIPLPLADSVKRILNIALFDDKGTLSNERLFLTRKQKNYHVSIQLDKLEYGRRELVKMKIHIQDAAGKPVSSNLSMAVVTHRALEEARIKTILQSDYNTLTRTAERHTTFNDDESTFNDLLIGKSWGRYSWSNIAAFQPKGNIILLNNSSGVTGYIKPKRNNEIKLKELFVFSTAGPRIVTIQPNGRFSIPVSDLIVDDKTEAYIVVKDGFHSKYSLILNNFNDLFDERIKKAGIFNQPTEFLVATREPEAPPLSGVIQLSEVKIVSQQELDQLTIDKLNRDYDPNCGDYVCKFGILNCKAHVLEGSRPVIGEQYALRGKGVIVYTKCVGSGYQKPSNNILLPGVNLPRNFPAPDYGKESLSTPEVMSTLFWRPNIFTDKNGNAELQFYTSDLSGSHKIILQGVEIVTSKGIYARAGFTVR
jgi:hypothetical protein